MNGKHRNGKAPGAATPEAQSSDLTTTKGEHMNTSTDLALNVVHGDATMSSREIADLTGKRHNNVMRDIKSMVKALKEHRSDLSNRVISSIYIDASGISRTQYMLDREMTMTLVTGYSIPLRNNVIQRWQQLELKAAYPQIPQTMGDALRLAADQAELIDQQKRELLELAPKAAFSDQVEIAEDAITVGEAAKLIGTGRTRLFAFLRNHGWVNRRNEPYQAKIEAGLLDVKVGHWEHPEEGLKENVTALVTGKGLVRLQRLWAEAKEHSA